LNANSDGCDKATSHITAILECDDMGERVLHGTNCGKRSERLNFEPQAAFRRIPFTVPRQK
jgi:hypothetical protein